MKHNKAYFSLSNREEILHQLDGSSTVIIYGREYNGSSASLRMSNLSKSVMYLDFLGKLGKDVTLIVYECLRYATWNNTKYNKIYNAAAAVGRVIVIDTFPFVFDHRNIFVTMKLLGINKYHPVQFYDDSFFIKVGDKNVRANSVEAYWSYISDHIVCDTKPLTYKVVDWLATLEEMEEYERFKHDTIMVRKCEMVKTKTKLQGHVNRMESKVKALGTILSKYPDSFIYYNWENGIKGCKERYGEDVNAVSYHTRKNHGSVGGNVIFFETIISQKIKLYDALSKHGLDSIILFLNDNIGIDKINCVETLSILNELNKFYDMSRNGTV